MASPDETSPSPLLFAPYVTDEPKPEPKLEPKLEPEGEPELDKEAEPKDDGSTTEGQ